MAESVAEASAVSSRPGSGAAVGWTAALTSAAMFGTSGGFAKPLLDAGWTAAAAVLVRLGGAALLLLLPGLWAVRGRWEVLAQRWRPIVMYGLFGGAMVQVAYFNAIQTVPVGVALLVEYLGVVLVVVWVWLRTRRRPGPVTLSGMTLALGGLVVVLNPTDLGSLDPGGMAWAFLAAFGMAVYFVTAAETDGIPPVTFVAAGLGVGTVVLAVAGLVGLVPLRASMDAVSFNGDSVWPWWVPLVELVVIAAAGAYLLGFVGARHLGSTVASFVGLTEVVFAVLWAWLLLGELPGPVQLIGGVTLLLGVAAVQSGTRRDGRAVEAVEVPEAPV